MPRCVSRVAMGSLRTAKSRSKSIWRGGNSATCLVRIQHAGLGNAHQLCAG